MDKKISQNSHIIESPHLGKKRHISDIKKPEPAIWLRSVHLLFNK